LRSPALSRYFLPEAIGSLTISSPIRILDVFESSMTHLRPLAIGATTAALLASLKSGISTNWTYHMLFSRFFPVDLDHPRARRGLQIAMPLCIGAAAFYGIQQHPSSDYDEVQRQKLCKQADDDLYNFMPELSDAEELKLSALGQKLRSLHDFKMHSSQGVLAQNQIDVIKTCPEMTPTSIVHWRSRPTSQRAEYASALEKQAKARPDSATLAYVAGELVSLSDSTPAGKEWLNQGMELYSELAAENRDDSTLALSHCEAYTTGGDLMLVPAEELIYAASGFTAHEDKAVQLCGATMGLDTALQYNDIYFIEYFAQRVHKSEEANADDRLKVNLAMGRVALERGDVTAATNVLRSSANMVETSFSRGWSHISRPEWSLAVALQNEGHHEAVADYVKRYQQDGRHRPLPTVLLATVD
jgi:hypothetical protein